MQSMPLVQVHGVDDVRLDEVSIPSASADDVLVKVARCGICGSDLGYIAMGGLTAPGQPMPLGHELAGVVAELGANVSHLQPGQRVVVNPTANGTDIGNGGPEGGFAPLLLVSNVAAHPQAVLPIPDDISFDEGALVEPLAVAMHAVNQSGIRAGQCATILGAGPIGLCTVVVLRYFGIENIVVADRSPRRLSVAQQLGARPCNIEQEDIGTVLQQEQGESRHYGMPVAATDVYIEATGVGPVLEQAISLARPGATIVVVGVHKQAIQLNPLDLLMKELRLVGSMAYPKEFPLVIEMLEGRKLDVLPLISHHFPLADFQTALTVASDPMAAAKVMVSLD